jgi:hypothetical protein
MPRISPALSTRQARTFELDVLMVGVQQRTSRLYASRRAENHPLSELMQLAMPSYGESMRDLMVKKTIRLSLMPGKNP